MTQSYDWRRAERGDHDAIATFVCAVPAKPLKSAETGWKPFHPRSFEFEAQCIIRGLASNHSLPTRGAVQIWVAEDTDGIAAVVSWTKLSAGDFHLDVMGIAPRHRRQPGAAKGVFARQVLKSVLSEMEAQAIEAGADELYVEGEIYRSNDASIGMCTEVGLAHHMEHPTGASTYNMRVPLEGADF